MAGACDPATSALTRTVQSPLVVSKAYSLGGKALGTGQYTDIFRRSEFFKQTSAAGINPGYHVKLNVSTLPAQTVHVPAAAAAEFGAATPCGEKTGAFEINWWDSFLTSTLLPSLRAQGVTESDASDLPAARRRLFDTVTSNCCILGYHSFTSTARAARPTRSATTESSGRFTGSTDISRSARRGGGVAGRPVRRQPDQAVGQHRAGRRLPEQPRGGDPLSGTDLTVATSGHTYHPQELAFFSWFYHSRPGLGVNGLFSNNGTFTTAAPACP